MDRAGLNLHREGVGAPLLLLHGLGSRWEIWRPMLPRLTAEREVLAPDLPGFGRSAPLASGGEPGIGALADAVEAELTAAGLDRVDMVGNSLGGWLALELARRGRGRRVVAFSTVGLDTARERAYTVRGLRAMRASAERLAPWAERLTATAPGRALVFGLVAARPWRLTPAEAAGALRGLAEAPGFHATLAATVARGADPGALAEVRVPVLVAWGSRDLLVPPRQGPRYPRLMPSAELRVLPGLGHVPMGDDPRLCAEIVLDFMGDRPGARPRAAPRAAVPG